MKTGNRHTTRIPGHDYSGPADYFVTLCTENRECLFGNVINGQMYLNAIGQIVREEWQRNYNEHIIDNNEELERIRQYIEDNPKHWNSE